MNAQFARIADDAIAEYCAAHPAEATLLGNHEHDDRLEDLSQSAAERRRTELRRLIEQLDGLTGLDESAAVDREMLRTESSRELLSLTAPDEPSWDAPRHNPGTALYALIAQDSAPLPDRLAMVAARLRAVPDYFAVARQRLTDPPRPHVEAAIGQLTGTHDLITEEITRLAEQADLVGMLAEPIERAAAAVLQLIATRPPLYYVGLLEVRRLVADLRAAHPSWSDRTLHDTMLGHGSPPVGQLRTLLGLPG